MIRPPKLRDGDVVAIVSPASVVRREFVEGAVQRLRDLGLKVTVMPHAVDSQCGSFASQTAERAADLLAAWRNPDVKAILCARGGYGCVHLLPYFKAEELKGNPKWLIGFSDVSALHAMLYRAGVMSLHSPMAKHLALEPEDDEATVWLMRLLTKDTGIDYRLNPHPLNRQGEARGILRGGNMAVLDGLSATPYNILDVSPDEEVILFIEDIAEPLYKIDRMLWRLKLNGTLDNIKGLIVGQFTEYKPDANWPDAETLISTRLKEWGLTELPVVFGFPVGHVTRNLPLIEGASATLSVSPAGTRLTTAP